MTTKKRKTPPATQLTEAATLQRVNDVTERNNERELSLMQRSNGSMNPLAVLEQKLETFFRVILGEARYMQYMLEYQAAREQVLDQWESALLQSEIRRGVADFNLVDAGGSPLGTAS